MRRDERRGRAGEGDVIPDRDAPLIERWATSRGLTFQGRPSEDYFRRWEPFDTITPPYAYVNACTHGRSTSDYIVLVEPWYGTEVGDALDRTVFAFVSHPKIGGRAAASVGEYFVTRVSFLESAPVPRVTLGDTLWDEHVATVARSEEEARRAFHPALRKVLAARGFRGHLEMRGAGMVLFCAGIPATPGGYEELLARAKDLRAAAIGA